MSQLNQSQLLHTVLSRFTKGLRDNVLTLILFQTFYHFHYLVVLYSQRTTLPKTHEDPDGFCFPGVTSSLLI